MKQFILSSFCLVIFASSLFSQKLMPRQPVYYNSNIKLHKIQEGNSTITKVFVNPFILRETDTYTLYVIVKKNNVRTLQIKHINPGIFINGVSDTNYVDLYNDGTHGDETAGDSIFTLSNLTPSPYEYDWLKRNTFLTSCVAYFMKYETSFLITFNDGTQKTEIPDSWNDPTPDWVEIIHLRTENSPTVVKIYDNMYATPHVVNIVVDPFEIYPQLNLECSPITNKFYSFFNDDYDFLIIDFNFLMNCKYPFNLEEGIRRTAQFLKTKDYDDGVINRQLRDVFYRDGTIGSAGRLSGIIQIERKAMDNMATLNHEILHNWGIYIKGLGESHWSGIEYQGTGFGGYTDCNGVFSSINNVSGTYYDLLVDKKDYPSRDKFNDLELYLAGFIGIHEVEFPIKALANPTLFCIKSFTDSVDIYSCYSDSIVYFAKDSILSQLGPRNPDVSNSQKSFNVCLIVPTYKPLSQIEMGFLDMLMRAYEKENSPKVNEQDNGLTFYNATHEKATIHTGLFGLPTIPVELISFTAKDNGNKVILNWSTATETNNKGFEIQRASSESFRNTPRQGEWEKIGFISGHGTSTQPHQYSFIDKSVSTGVYYYRLKQTDFDGSYKYSNEIEVNFSVPNKYELSQNYPNPFNPTTVIKYQLKTAGRTTLIIYNLLGQEVKTLVNEVQSAGEHKVEWNASGIASGVYLYRLQAGKFVDTKKLILIK